MCVIQRRTTVTHVTHARTLSARKPIPNLATGLAVPMRLTSMPPHTPECLIVVSASSSAVLGATGPRKLVDGLVATSADRRPTWLGDGYRMHLMHTARSQSHAFEAPSDLCCTVTAFRDVGLQPWKGEVHS